MKKLMRIILENEVLAILLVVLGITSYFSKLAIKIDDFWKFLGISNEIIVQILTPISILLIWLLFILLISFLKNTKKISLIQYTIQPEVFLSNDGSDDRLRDFRRLRIDAQKSIFSMGIGMTYFSQDKKLLDDLLQQGIHIRLLMVNPEVFKEQPFNQIYDPLSGNNYIDEYFDRNGYTSDIETSYKRLVQYIDERKKKQNRKGSIQLRRYSFFHPINFTVIDEKVKKGDKMLFEYILPFSANRVRIKLNRKDHSEFYQLTLETCEKMWENSIDIIKDF